MSVICASHITGWIGSLWKIMNTFTCLIIPLEFDWTELTTISWWLYAYCTIESVSANSRILTKHSCFHQKKTMMKPWQGNHHHHHNLRHCMFDQSSANLRWSRSTASSWIFGGHGFCLGRNVSQVAAPVVSPQRGVVLQQLIISHRSDKEAFLLSPFLCFYLMLFKGVLLRCNEQIKSPALTFVTAIFPNEKKRVLCKN